jgi:hypothetical protein
MCGDQAAMLRSVSSPEFTGAYQKRQSYIRSSIFTCCLLMAISLLVVEQALFFHSFNEVTFFLSRRQEKTD